MGFWRSAINAKKYIEGNKKVERTAVVLVYTAFGAFLWKISGKDDSKQNSSSGDHLRASE